MDLIQKASKLGYKHYTEFTVKELDKLPISNNSKQIECYFIQKWLREVHNIDVNPICTYKNGIRLYHLGIIFINSNNKIDTIILKSKIEEREHINMLFKNYEEALEVGIFEALKLIK